MTAGSRRVQSARSKVTWRWAKSCSNSGSDKVVRLLYWHVTHQAAVKSTNTGRPWAKAACCLSAVQACHDTPSTAVVVAASGAAVSRVMLGPMVQAVATNTTAVKTAMPLRAPPFRPHAHTTALSDTKSINKAAAPSIPLCWPSTHSSHTTVANMGNDKPCRKVFIQAPGRGRARATAGHQLANR